MRGSARGCESNGHLLKKWYKPITLDGLRAYAAKHAFFDAEGKGLDRARFRKSFHLFILGRKPITTTNLYFGG